MNSMERIQAAITGESIDRRAFAPVLGLYGARLTNCPLEKYYTEPDAYVRGQTAVREIFQPDVLLAPLVFSFIGAAFGSELKFLETTPPNVRRPVLRSAEEWERIVVPDPDTHPKLLYFQEVISRMAMEHKKQIAIVMAIPIPVDIPILIMGMESWLNTVLFDPSRASGIMDKIIPFYVRLVNNFFAAGATFVVMPCGFASPSVVTREIVLNFTRPVLEQTLVQLNGPIVFHNIGAPILAHLDLLTGLPSTIGFIVDQQDDLARSRQVIGPDSVLFGGFDCEKIGQMTADEVEERCLRILEERRQDRHFVLGTSGPDVVWSTPPDNIHAMRKAVKCFGKIDYDQ